MNRFSSRWLALLLGSTATFAACGQEPDVGPQRTSSTTTASGGTIRSQVAAALQVEEETLAAQEAPDASADELALFQTECTEQMFADDEGYAAPTPPSLPAPKADLPPACDEQARSASLEAECGPIADATGATLAEAFAACAPDTTCRITLPAGDFEGNLVLGCVILQGAGDDTRIHGAVGFDRPSILARVAVDDAYGAVGTTASLLVNEATLRGGYEGLGFAWDAAIDVAVCRSRVAGGYSGVAQSWGSEKLTVAGSGVAACYEAVATSWGSEGLHVQQNVLFGGYSGVHIHRSLASAVVGNAVFGRFGAVDAYVEPPYFAEEDQEEMGIDEYEVQTIGVVVAHNTILGGALPEESEELNIVVEDNDQP